MMIARAIDAGYAADLPGGGADMVSLGVGKRRCDENLIRPDAAAIS
jgi:hypothetical protein